MTHAPPTIERHRWLFQWLRVCQLGNHLRQLSHHAKVRLATFAIVSLIVWGAVFAASYEGFHYLRQRDIPFAGGIIGAVFDYMFLALGTMLIFSGSIILYSSLFTSPEARFLLTTPARADLIFAYKFQGAIAFSSWAFLLLGSPVLIAYGLFHGGQGVPWTYYALLPLFLLGFVLLPGSLGACVCLLVANTIPQHRKHLVVAAGLACFAISAWWVGQWVRAARITNVTSGTFQELIDQVSFARSFLIPSHWMTRGLQAAARGNAAETGYHLGLIWSNGLFSYLLTAWLARHCYRRGYNRLATGGSLRRRYGGNWMDRLVSGLVAFLHPQTRLLIVKDFRTFRRDPAQWVQVVIFVGLMTLYFANTRRFYQADIGRPYQNGISLLNLAATAVLMCAYTGRFIFPLLSLEGRKFWILGLLPLQRDRLLWGKFAFAALGTLLVAEGLILVSDSLLGIPAVAIGLHALTVAVLALGLSGLSVGLGAWLANFRETDPSKIVVGFGGTLNLIVSLLFLLLEVGLMAAPYHLYVAFKGEAGWHEAVGQWWFPASILVGVLAGLAAVVIPLRIGIHTLRRMEF